MKNIIIELVMNVILYYYHLGLSTNADNTIHVLHAGE